MYVHIEDNILAMRDTKTFHFSFDLPKEFEARN